MKPFLADNTHLRAEDAEPELNSPLRKRCYSDVDQMNYQALTLNVQTSLSKVCDQKLKCSKSKKKCKKEQELKDKLEAIKQKENLEQKPLGNEVFARAVKNFAQKLGKTLPKVRT